VTNKQWIHHNEVICRMIMKKLYLLSLVVAFAFGMIACQSNEKSGSENGETTTEVDKSGPEYTSAFTCPMHCKGSGSASAGTCPVCEMDYVANSSSTPVEEPKDTSVEEAEATPES
jgi:hypothetical protein